MGVGKGSSSPPPAPDYMNLAREQQAGNMIGQNTPWGSLAYTQSGTDKYGNPMYTANVNLSPEMQALFEKQVGLQGQAMDHVNFNPIQIDPSLNGMTGQEAVMSRIQPMMDQQKEQFDAQMANQGAAPGSDAYNNAYRQLYQSQNDMRNAAVQTGFNVDNQLFGEQAYNQQMPFNAMAALQHGVQMPQFINTPSGPNYMQAGELGYQGALNGYNASAASSGNMMDGLFGLGGSLFMGAGQAGGFGNLFSGIF